eukprot:gene6964-19_t
MQVRLCDQENINEFGRLNNKLLELQADMKQFTMDVEKLEDGASELMMVTDDKVMLFIGESFIECTEEYATEYCENKAEATKQRIADMKRDEDEIIRQQGILKKDLYARFGDTINLEN